MTREYLIPESDLLKVLDAVRVAAKHHLARDSSNASLHLAAEVRHSPLTSELISAQQRLEDILAKDPEPQPPHPTGQCENPVHKGIHDLILTCKTFTPRRKPQPPAQWVSKDHPGCPKCGGDHFPEFVGCDGMRTPQLPQVAQCGWDHGAIYCTGVADDAIHNNSDALFHHQFVPQTQGVES